MQLLFRTIVIFTFSLGILALAGVFVQNYLERYWGQNLIGEVSKDRQFLWEKLLDERVHAMKDLLDSIQSADAFSELVAAGDSTALNQAMLGWNLGEGYTGKNVAESSGQSEEHLAKFTQMAIFNSQLSLIYSSENRLNFKVAVPKTILEKVVQGKLESATGMGYNDQLSLLQNIVFPIFDNGEIVGIGVLSIGVEGVLKEMQNLIGAQVFVVNRYNRLIVGEDRGLWREFSPLFEDSDKRGFNSIADSRENFYRLVKFPITDMYGSLQTFVITVKDINAEQAKQSNIDFILNSILVAMTVFVIFLISLLLRQIFRPLEEGATILVSLARGESIESLGNEFNDDEIGRILNAVETLRLRTVHLRRLRRSRWRQRWRINHILFTEIKDLADNLDDTNRTEIIEDLDAIKQEMGGLDSGDSSEDFSNEEYQDSGSEMVVIASAFRKLAFRITEKQKHLNRVIADLEESLKTEVAYLALQKELDLAHKVQLSFIPDTGLQIRQAELRGYMRPAKTVGGDLFDYFVIDENRIGFCVGDVSDKGVPAALFMMVARIVLWLVARQELSTAKVLEEVNNAIYSNNPNHFFVSIFYGYIDINTGEVHYSCAGHPPAICIDVEDGSAKEVEVANDLVVGVFEDVKYQEHQTILSSGSSLFIYSDGISEAMDKDENQYGEERLLSLLKIFSTDKEADAGKIINGVTNDVTLFTGDNPQSDDITCIVVHYTGNDN